MIDAKEFLAEMQKQRQRFFPEAPVIYLEELSFYVKTRIILSEDSFVEVRFNAHNARKSYALVRDGKRVAGFDNLGGWHIHPFGKPHTHRRISEPPLAHVFEYFLRGV
ncbi:MAG: hypothetical protein AAB533_04225 [Patescibacteria group bacterium]